MSTPFEPRMDRPGPRNRPSRGDTPPGYQPGPRMGRNFFVVCEECGASVAMEQVEVHTAWHAQMAALLPPPGDGGVV